MQIENFLLESVSDVNRTVQKYGNCYIMYGSWSGPILEESDFREFLAKKLVPFGITRKKVITDKYVIDVFAFNSKNFSEKFRIELSNQARTSYLREYCNEDGTEMKFPKNYISDFTIRYIEMSEN